MRAYGLTDIGNKRNMNQDYIFVSENPVGKLPNLMIVADGMGGHRAGDVASRSAVESFLDSVRKSKDSHPVIVMENAVVAANNRVIELATSCEDYFGMGTTLVAVTVIDRMAYIINVGDSRLYLLHNELKQITRDHSMVEEMMTKGNLSNAQAVDYGKKNKNVITRAIGGEPDVMADFFEVEVEDGDFLLLCSDGLSNMVEDDEIQRIILEEDEIDKAVHRLVETANNNGGLDNISAVLGVPYKR